MVKHAEQSAIGDGFKPGVANGPLQNRVQYDRVKTFFDDIAEHGWYVALGGKMDDHPLNGYSVRPTIIDSPLEKLRIVVKEAFGNCIMSPRFYTNQSLILKALSYHFFLGRRAGCH